MPSFRSHIAPVPGIDDFDEEAVLARIHLVESDVLLLSGSLVDGSGTPSSDFDFCVVAESEDDRFHRGTFPRGAHMRYYTSGDRVKASFDYLPQSLLGVDVEYWTVQEITDMLDAHANLYRYMRTRARKSSGFSASAVDFRLLSRLSYAVPLTNAAAFEKIAEAVRPGEIAYTAFRTAVGSYPDFRDLAGMWAQGDHESALVAARKLGADTFRGLTHVYGNTNRNPKYLARFLSRLPARLSGLTERFRHLYSYGPGSASGAPGAVLEWLDLIDLAFAEIRRARDEAEAFVGRAEFLGLLKAELHESMSWNAEISNEYCFRAREAEDGLPPLRDVLAALEARGAVEHALPLRQWASGRTAPLGENNKSA
ncbi:nucleotidyltransferase domain-containing protein [Streptomyces spinosus]|uniref:nucleotidyltransferase domain-containing protein n=1 Tax=Streptomyces spinosus TaxID=2872623 RepID=UPI001CED2EA7|nr:nucleotidyltransferase domain-containing protein [Streptomyces spinosus]